MALTITEMKKRNAEAGFNWFEKESMSVFGIKIEASPNARNVFITSEWAGFKKTKRKYTLRYFNTETNKVETIGVFLQFETLEEARVARKNYGVVEEAE